MSSVDVLVGRDSYKATPEKNSLYGYSTYFFKNVLSLILTDLRAQHLGCGAVWKTYIKKEQTQICTYRDINLHFAWYPDIRTIILLRVEKMCQCLALWSCHFWISVLFNSSVMFSVPWARLFESIVSYTVVWFFMIFLVLLSNLLLRNTWKKPPNTFSQCHVWQEIASKTRVFPKRVDTRCPQQEKNERVQVNAENIVM